MKARLVELPSNVSSPPHCCIVTGRIDAPVIDFGDPTAKAQGPNDPRIYIRAAVVEKAARDLLGMVPQAEVDDLLWKLEASEGERRHLAEKVEAAQGLREAAELAIEVFAGDAGDEPDTDDDTDNQEEE